jgi:serine/threonine protein kinase
MGSVYLAEDFTLKRQVAVKLLSAKLERDEEARARFLREARSMASVEHARIVRVYSFGETEGRAYLVMEYVEGGTLAERIGRERRLSLAEAFRVLDAIAEALEAAWQRASCIGISSPPTY